MPKLDSSDPAQAHRIQQRKRTIDKGKNTVGYDEYVKRVSRSRRKPRSLEHPTTPDHTVDISNKRWIGLVRAWRKALHQFDPPEMQQVGMISTSSTTDATVVEGVVAKSVPTPKHSRTVQERQIADASEYGLPVDFGATAATPSLISPDCTDRADKLSFPRDFEGEEDGGKTLFGFRRKDNDIMEEADVWEAWRDPDGEYGEDFPVDYDDDSDDDLL